MNVLWHMPTLRANTCGLSRRALRYAGALREAGHDVSFLVRRDSTDIVAELDGFPVHRVDTRRAEAPHWSLQALARRAAVKRVLRGRSTDFDLFVTCQPEAVLAHESGRSAAPCVFVCGGSTLLHDDALAERMLDRCTGARRLWNSAALVVDRWFKRDAERRAMQRADAVVFNSQTTFCRARESYDIDSPKMTAIVGGVDTRVFRPPTGTQRNAARAALRLPADSFVIAWTGRISAEKGVARLLEAAQAVSGLAMTVLLAGDGPERTAMEALARRLGLEARVCFVGALGDVRPILHAADVFVFPSVGESFGNAMAEAMACGLPCIGLRSDGRGVKNANIELLDDGRAGLLVDPASPVGLAQAIGQLAACARLREELGRAARARAVTEFCWRAAEARFVRLAERVARVARGATVCPAEWDAAPAPGTSMFSNRLVSAMQAKQDAAARERLQLRTS